MVRAASVFGSQFLFRARFLRTVTLSFWANVFIMFAFMFGFRAAAWAMFTDLVAISWATIVSSVFWCAATFSTTVSSVS